jgi:hypothetical protein
MKLHRLRARLLSAMGVVAACSPAEPPEAPPPAAPAGPVANPELAESPAAESIVDAAAPAIDAVVAPASDAGTSSPDATTSAAPAFPPAPKSAWEVSFKLLPGKEKWCTHGTVRCQPAADTVAAPGGAKPKLGCPAAIEVGCPCIQDDCALLGACEARLHANLSLRERAKEKTACCYELPRKCIPPYVGRPLRVDGELWRDPSANLDEWAAIAALEHASVASFARVALELLCLGAPPELVRDTLRAALDEIEHAEIARGVAGLDRAPAPLPEAGRPLGAVDLASFAAATFRDGCLEETLGAVIASDMAISETDPTTRAALARIAEDETRHAELAWRTLAWAARAGGEPVLARVRAELARAVAGAGSDARRRALLGEVVAPCVRALASLS